MKIEIGYWLAIFSLIPIIFSLATFISFVIFFATTNTIDWGFVEPSLDGIAVRLLLILISGCMLLLYSLHIFDKTIVVFGEREDK